MGIHKVYGKNLGTWGLLNDHHLAITAPEDVETILSNSKLLNKSHDYNFIRDWLGTGLLISTGQKWHSHRKIITPTFHFKILEQFTRTFDGQTSVLVDKVKSYAATGEEVNIYKYVTLCALDIISETAMGTKINAQDQPGSEYVSAVKEMSMIVFRRAYSIHSQFDWIFPFTGLYREQKKLLRVLHGFSSQMIGLRRAQLMNEVVQKKEGKKLCFLDLLLNANGNGASLSDTDIRDEVDTFMFGGHDTTTSGISFTLYHLSRHPEILERVYEEIVSVLESTAEEDRKFDYRALHELKYLEMVIKESMRITPPVPLVARTLTEDVVIGGVKCPAGLTIDIPFYAMHHSEDVFPQPDKFDPERFSLENVQQRHPYAYLPFSAGNRNCIGQKFAMLEMKAMIGKLLLNYKFLPGDSDVVLQADIILRSVDGVKVRIERR